MKCILEDDERDILERERNGRVGHAFTEDMVMVCGNWVRKLGKECGGSGTVKPTPSVERAKEYFILEPKRR